MGLFRHKQKGNMFPAEGVYKRIQTEHEAQVVLIGLVGRVREAAHMSGTNFRYFKESANNTLREYKEGRNILADKFEGIDVSPYDEVVEGLKQDIGKRFEKMPEGLDLTLLEPGFK